MSPDKVIGYLFAAVAVAIGAADLFFGHQLDHQTDLVMIYAGLTVGGIQGGYHAGAASILGK